MSQPVIMVTGANGQLGKTFQALAVDYSAYRFIFLSKEDLPVHNDDQVHQFFEKHTPAFCINCAAYTAVDKAEADRETAMLVNGDSAGNLAKASKTFNTRFIHISTDYVFDGTATVPYAERDATSPVNYYGTTKLKGEELAMQFNAQSIVIRTSWVYSQYGNNFVKTMMRLMNERTTLNVVEDQKGSPTYASDLAGAILDIIKKTEKNADAWIPGLYHYSNEGVISWYEFAVAIKKITGSNCILHPIPTASYPTPAKRPAYSAFSKEKIKATWQLAIQDWETSLGVALTRMQ